MRLFAWIVALPLAVLAAIFAVANRSEIRFDLWPLPFAVDLPAYLAVLGPLGVGLVLGLSLGWTAAIKARLRTGEQRRRAESLARQLDAARISPPQA